jgi:ATP-dependent Clp protease ATP-binding subunit ClpB
VVIMTSNIGSHYILEHSGGDWDETEGHVLRELQRGFRPEFLNRVDDIIVFRPLGEAELYRIVELQLRRVERLLADRRITLEPTDAAKAVVAREGHDPAYGARPLKRAIQRLIQNPLALRILEEDIPEGARIVADADHEGTGIRFTVVPAPGREPTGVGEPA